MIITREKGMRMWGGGSGSTSASGVNGGGGFSLAVTEGEGTGNAYTDFTYESGTLTLNKGSEFVTVDFFNKLFTAYDANGNVIAPNNTTPTLDNIKFKAGAWTEQYLSALGQNSSGGGGGGGIELSDVWQSLKTNTDDYANQKINSAHIPDLSGTYATKTWVNQQGFVTSSGVTSVAMTVPTGLSVSGSPITSTGTLALTLTSGYSIPTTTKQGNWDTAYGWGNHATAGYASASSVATLQGYFTNGVANTAAKLNTGTTTYSAWGQTYWSSGVPQSISGNMTSVGSITPSANGNNLGTTSARFNIYGTSGNFSGNVSITGTLGVTGATTLTGLLTANGGIVVPSSKTIKIGDCTISWDSTNSMLKFDTGIYSTGAVSALGSNSSGGGSGTFDEEAMWTALGTTITAKKISNNYLNLASWAKASSKPSYTFSEIGSKPTTLSGYGISDAYTKTQVDNALGGYLTRKAYSLDGKTAVRITFNSVNGGIISARVTKQSGSLVLIGNGYGDEGIVRNNWVQISESTGYFSWCIPTATGIEKSVEIYNNDTTTASIVVASFDTDVTFTELSALSTTASTVKVAYASDYLPLSGGTMTGTLTTPKIRINTRHSSNNKTGGLYYYDGTTDYLLIGQGSANLWIGANETAGTHHTGDTYISAGSGNAYISRLVNNTRNAYLILDSGNYSSYALPLSGGQMTGELTWKNETALSGVTSTNYVLCIDGFADGGTTHYITTANLSVGSATKATQDGSGRTITSTYLTDIGINSNNNLTQTKNGTASVVGNLLERNHTVKYNLSAAGWYRIGTFMNTLNQGNVCFLFVRREFNSQNNESYIFAITTGYSGAITISQLSGQANIHQMTKIRVDYVNNTSTKPAIDIYMSTANQNNYAFTIIGSAQLSSTATINPTLIGSQYEYSTVSGMGTSRNFTAVGEVTASSDARLKTIVGDATLSLKDIANAPNVLFRWNDGRDDKVHGGSIAQYWLQKASQFVCGEENGYYSLNYGALGTSLAISVAKYVLKHEDEITRLKKEVVKLRERVAELEERRA